MLALLPLTSCGDLPEPFLGNPGATARRLSIPPPQRLAVPTPAQALLPERDAETWAKQTADALDAQEVPATAARSHRGDWQLVLAAKMNGAAVVPSYTVVDPRGQPKGTATGAPIPAEAWASADPQILAAAADNAAPQIASLLTSIDAALRRTDPHSLLNRPARVYLAPVTGAPGDGDASLAREMRLKIPDNGDVVQDTPEGADFIVAGVVTTRDVPDNEQQIEIHWRVRTADGKLAGDVAQGHDMPKGALDTYWGDVAVAVATEAAGGVHEVISNWSGRKAAAKLAPAAGAKS